MSDIRQRINFSQLEIVKDLIDSGISTCCLTIDKDGIAHCSVHSAPFMEFKKICKKCREGLMK